MQVKNQLELFLTDRNNPNEKFLPSRNGFKFGNAFQPQKYALFFDHAAGMCGGMVFAVKDFHESGRIPLSTAQVPTIESNEVLLNYIAERQIDSVKQSSLLNYIFPRNSSQDGLEKVYNQIKHDLRENHLSILGLIRATNLQDIAKNHQVGVYGLTEDAAGNVELSIYDPRGPNKDDIKILFNCNHFNNFTSSEKSLAPIYSFFHPTYTYKMPPENVPNLSASTTTTESTLKPT